jgi:hypothetical protein
LSGVGGPHGQSLGIMECLHKKELAEGKWSVSFLSDSGSALFTLSHEDAEYFVEGQSYEFKATQP